jgi:small subunit ribosomal protein S13
MIYLFYKYVKIELSLHEILFDVYGLNIRRIELISKILKVKMSIKLKELNKYKVHQLDTLGRTYFNIERRLKRISIGNLVEKTKGASYKGLRLRQGLPTRGQRTHSNASTINRMKNSWQFNVKKKELGANKAKVKKIKK